MKHPLNKLLLIFTLFFIGYLLYTLSSVLIPFVIGILLAYCGVPMVRKLDKWGMPHIVSVVLTFLTILCTITLLVLLMVPFIHNQIVALNAALPKMINWIQNKGIPLITPYLSDQKGTGNIKEVFSGNLVSSDSIKWVLQTTFKSGKTAFEFLLYFILVPVVLFYLLRDWEPITENIKSIIPHKNRSHVITIVNQCEEVLWSFFRGQVIVITALSFIYALGFYLIGLQAGIAIGVMMGILSFVPYLGLIVGVVIATIAAIVQFGTMSMVIWVWIIITGGHIIDNLFLTPTLLGERIGLHPVIVIFAVLAGGTLLGFVGVLLALPIAAVLMVIMRHFYRRYYMSEI